MPIEEPKWLAFKYQGQGRHYYDGDDTYYYHSYVGFKKKRKKNQRQLALINCGNFHVSVLWKLHRNKSLCILLSSLVQQRIIRVVQVFDMHLIVIDSHGGQRSCQFFLHLGPRLFTLLEHPVGVEGRLWHGRVLLQLQKKSN